jgi:pimeloyl-ACP methyl ester carboxylesterase
VAKTAGATSCVNHRRHPKVAACGRCGSALCTECIVHTPVGVKCRNCTGATASSRSRRDDVTAGARRRPWAIPLAVAGLVVLVVAAFGIMSRGSEPTVTEDLDTGLAAPMLERHTTFAGPGGVTLGGTLTLPGDARKVPGVLIVPGLGAIDRNTVSASTDIDARRDAVVVTLSGKSLGSSDTLYKDMAESLARAGVASFRYDKRGTEGSPLKPGQTLSFDDEVGDARVALALLGERQEIGDAPLGIIGHDTGGLVAMRLAAAHNRVRSVAAVSTPGRPLVDVLADDMARGRGPAVADAFRAAVATLTSSGKAPPADTVPELLRPLFAGGHDAYLGTVLSLDPRTEAAAVPIPIALVRGGADKSVTSADTDRLVAVLRAGNEVMVGSAQADHNLSTAGSGPGHEHSNSVTGPVDHRDKDAVERLSTWLRSRLSG